MKKLMLALFNTIVPGTANVYLGKIYQGISFQITLYLLIGFFAYSREIIKPQGILILVFLILILHFYAGLSIFFSKINCSKNNVVNSSIFVAITLAVIASIFFHKHELMGVDIHKISSSSMEPTLFEGDYIISDTWIYKKTDPQIGDIILFQPAKNKSTFIVKRVHPFPDYLAHKNQSFYLLGDNPSNSMDSRYLGPIDSSQAYGKYKFILLSTSAKRKIIMNKKTDFNY